MKKREPYTEIEKEIAKQLGIKPASVRKTYSSDIKEGRRQAYEEALNNRRI